MPKKKFICDYCGTEFERYDIGSRLHFCCIEHRRLGGKMVASNFSDKFKNAMRERCLNWNENLHKNPSMEKRIEISKRQREQRPTSGYTKRLGKHEHRVVMENILGRPLRRDEIVHHIDGNKANNNPSNLMIMSRSEHAKLHLSKPMGGDANANSV